MRMEKTVTTESGRPIGRPW